MLQFKAVTKQDGGKLRKYYQNCNYGLCEYSVGTKLMWRPVLHAAWAEVAGCLVVRNESHGHWMFDYPVRVPRGTRTLPWRPLRPIAWSRGYGP